MFRGIRDFFRFIFDVLLLDRFFEFVQRQIDNLRNRLRQIQAFSWQTLIFLSLFSWFVYLLIEDYDVKRFVSLLAWAFLILGTDWALLGRTILLPLIEIKVLYGPWVSGALICAALLSNRFLIYTFPTALTSWPIISVIVAGFSKFLKPGPTIALPDAAGRQDLVILFLIGSLLSCWFRFHYLIQDVLEDYPSLAADNLDKSSFVFRINPNSVPVTKGVPILETAESVIRTDLGNRSWIDVQRWLQTLQTELPQIRNQVMNQVFNDSPASKEQLLWRFNAQYLPNQATLRLLAAWRGPSSQGGGYILERSCQVSEAPLQSVTGADTRLRNLPRAIGLKSYQLSCQPITSNLKAVNLGKGKGRG
jgi:hypothetical protein